MSQNFPSERLIVTLLQNSAGDDVSRNLADIERLLHGCPRSDLIALPEVFAIRGSDDDYRMAAEVLLPPEADANAGQQKHGPIMEWLSALAVRFNSWVLAGSVIEKTESGFFNTSLALNRAGKLVAAYRKIHLFEAYLDNGKIVRERDVYEPGDEPCMVEIDGWLCGMAVCYDIRFPELFRCYSSRGAHLFFTPSNFTQKTGVDHWEVLLRARAIENQAFVVAPDQCGSNPCTDVASYGHSLVAGPWGELICDAGADECVISVTLDPEAIARTRERIPVLEHRRL